MVIFWLSGSESRIEEYAFLVFDIVFGYIAFIIKEFPFPLIYIYYLSGNTKAFLLFLNLYLTFYTSVNIFLLEF